MQNIWMPYSNYIFKGKRHNTKYCNAIQIWQNVLFFLRAKYNHFFFGLKYRHDSVRFLLYKTTTHFEISHCNDNPALHKSAVEAWQCSREPWLLSNPALCLQLHYCETQTSLSHTERQQEGKFCSISQVCVQATSREEAYPALWSFLEIKPHAYPARALDFFTPETLWQCIYFPYHERLKGIVHPWKCAHLQALQDVDDVVSDL